MSCINKISYQIYKADKGTYLQMLDYLFAHIDVKQSVLRIVLFGEISSNEAYICQLSLLRNKARLFFSNGLPVVTFVPQKPFDAKLVLEVHSYRSDENDLIEYKFYKDFPYVLLTNKYGKFLYAGGLHSTFNKDIYTQSEDVFHMLKCILNHENFPISSIIRQWNYIDHITAFNNRGSQHYQMFNNARSRFYLTDTWQNGYPAATGIGTLGGGVIVDVDAVIVNDSSFSIIPIDNRLQVAAHTYSSSVLEKADTGKATPKFERAKSLNINDTRIIYVSGTAAIRGEQSCPEADVVNQLHITFENIYQLIGSASIKLLRVYLKSEDYYNKVYNILSKRKDFYISYLLADVCRDELLIEIEGIACK